MNLFKKIKYFFVKPVELEKNQKGKIVIHSSHSGKINLNKTLAVPEGYICFLVAKEKTCDRFVAGDYKLSIENIPVICRLLKLNVPNKKGKYKSSFNADIYYVNLDEFVSKFESEQGVYIKKDKQFLGSTVLLKGQCCYKISDPQLFLDSMLKNYGVIKGRIAERQVEIWTGELVDKKVQKNKPSIEEIAERDSNCFDGLVEYLNKNTKDIGLEYSSIDILETILPKNIYKKTNLKYYEKEHKKENAQIEENKTVQPYFSNGQYVVKEDIQPSIEQVPSQPLLNQNNENAFDNTQLTEKFEGSVDNNSNQANFNFEQDIDDLVSVQNQKEDNLENENEKVQSNIEQIERIQRTIAYKKCKKCGAINPKSASICFECKSEFKKICQKCGAEIDSGDYVCTNCKSVVI